MATLPLVLVIVRAAISFDGHVIGVLSGLLIAGYWRISRNSKGDPPYRNQGTLKDWAIAPITKDPFTIQLRAALWGPRA